MRVLNLCPLVAAASPSSKNSYIKNKDHTENSPGYSLVVFPDIWMMHLLSFDISLELKGRTRTATFTEAPAMAPPC